MENSCLEGKAMMRWTGSSAPNPVQGPVLNQNRISVNVPTRAALLDDISTRLDAGQGFTLATLNLDHVVKLHQLPDFHAAYAAHTHVTADGNPIVWLSRLAGHAVELIPGSELIEPMVELVATKGWPIAFLGSDTQTLEATATALQARLPNLRIAAKIAPPMGFDPEGAQAEAYIAELNQSGARLCFLALGAPKQEIFAHRAFQACPQIGFASIGAGLDFIAGSQTRAPKLVRAFAAEWLWRLMGNPRRLAARYGACILVLPGLLRRALQARAQSQQDQAGTGVSSQ